MQKKDFPKISTIAIFVYWSKRNSVENNVLTYVTELLKVADTVLFVSNSPLASGEIQHVTELGAIFHQRENRGFDFWGWKEGIKLLENKIKKASNLILCNSSCYLAFPDRLDPLLQNLNDDADMWGISCFGENSNNFHLQSYFLMFKENLLNDWDFFIHFWTQLPEMPKWEDAVRLGEGEITRYFSKRFRCKSLINSTNLPSTDIDPSIYYPVNLLMHGSPFLKKKIFLADYSIYLDKSDGSVPSSSMNYIREKKGNYEEILSDLIVRISPTKLINSLHLNYLIGQNRGKIINDPKVAVICFVYYEDMVNHMVDILRKFEGLGDIYLISSKKEILSSYQSLLSKYKINAIYRLQENRGRNEAAYFLTCKDVWLNYEYVCALHDKKSLHVKPALLGRDFMKHCEQNLCPSRNSIEEIIEIFENNSLLGLLVPPFPFFGSFTLSIFHPLGQNKISINNLNDKLFFGKLFSSSDELDISSAPFGGMFWARTKALISLPNSALALSDFPKEPLKQPDGTILHAIERCYPMVTRLNGFYTARIININRLPLIYDNITYFTFFLSCKSKLLFTFKILMKKILSNHPRAKRIVKYIYRYIKLDNF